MFLFIFLMRQFEKLTLNKTSTKVKIPESIRGKKGVEGILPMTYDSVKM